MSHEMLCTMVVDDLLCGVEVLHVQEVLRDQHITRVPLAPAVVRGLMNLRGQIVTALDLRRRLMLPDRPAGLAPRNVIVRSGEAVVSLMVDDVGEVIDVSGETLERPPENLRGPIRELIRGAYKLEDRLLLLLDADRVAASSLQIEGNERCSSRTSRSG